MIRDTVSSFFFGIRDLVNGVSNTVWGLIIIFWAMYLLSRGMHIETAYCFISIGSTLLGISHTGQTSTITNSRVTIPASVNNVEGAADAKGED